MCPVSAVVLAISLLEEVTRGMSGFCGVETDGRTPQQEDIIKGRDLIPGEVHATTGDTGNKCGSAVSQINQIYLGKRIEYGFVTYSGELLYINIDVD